MPAPVSVDGLGVGVLTSLGRWGNAVQARPLFRVETLGSGDGFPGFGREVIRILWFLAGSAMLLFTVFLAVLLVAAIAFRLWPAGRRRRPRLVFTVSAGLVVVCVTVLAFPGSFRGVEAAFAAPASAKVDVPAQPPLGGETTPSSTPARWANGSATGDGLGNSSVRSLVLYDATETGELYATMLANLLAHFGGWTAHPVGTYHAGEMTGYDAVFYLGEPSGTAPPRPFLDDVAQDRHRVTWIGGTVGSLPVATRSGYGFLAQSTDTDQFVRMTYHGTSVPMDAYGGDAGYARISISDPKSVTVLATAYRADGSSAPWAVRSGNLTYLSENPLRSQGQLEARNLVFADLLFDALDPGARSRHRALVRLEDVNPSSDPTQLRAVVDYLSGAGIPFSVGVFPVFRDPNGVSGNGDVTIRLSERPALVTVLKYAVEHGGTLVMHGYTHQYGTKNNPNNGRSGDDAEFYLCHLDSGGQLVLDGHVPEDSQTWALGRLDQALAEFRAAGLTRPAMFEFPHYMASAADELAVGQRFDTRYERALYFPGALSGRPADDAVRGWQIFPYAVRDVYGMTVLPEDLDYVHSDGGNIAAMLDQARSNLVVRDGVASFFFHPFLSVDLLRRVVDGLRTMGYTFVAARDLAATP